MQERKTAGAMSRSQRRAWDPMHQWRTGLAGSVDSYLWTEQGSQGAWAQKGDKSGHPVWELADAIS